jgi:hypothetical protein
MESPKQLHLEVEELEERIAPGLIGVNPPGQVPGQHGNHPGHHPGPPPPGHVGNNPPGQVGN